MHSPVRSFAGGLPLAAALFALPVLSIYAPKMVSVLFILAAVAVLAGHALRGRSFAGLYRPGFLLLTPLLIWGAASALWSIDPVGSLVQAAKLLGILVAGTVVIAEARRLDPGEQASFGRAVVAGLGLGLGVLALEFASDFAIMRWVVANLSNRPELPGGGHPWSGYFNSSVSVMALAAWPAAVVLWTRFRWASLALIVLSLAVVSRFDSAAAALGLTVGLGAVVLALVMRRRLIPLLAGLVVLGTLGAPLLPPLLLDAALKSQEKLASVATIGHRVVIWNFTAERIGERPWVGWGLDSSRQIPGGGANPTDGVFAELVNREPGAAYLPLHPHNAALQVWLELGLPGAAIWAAIIAALFLGIGRKVSGQGERAICIGMICTALTIGFISYGIWQTWWLSSLWLCVAAVDAVLPRKARPIM